MSNTSVGAVSQADLNRGILSALKRLANGSGLNKQEIRVITKADEERNAVTSSGLIKLMLFMVQGTINWDTGEVTNLQLPEFSATFDEILQSSAAGRSQLLQSLLQTIFTDTPDKPEDRRDPMFKSMSMTVFTSAFISNLLDGNFTTEELTSLYAESNAINILSFLAQSRSDERVSRALRMEEKLKNEIRNQIDPINRSDMKLTMQILGGVESIDDITPIAANVNGICRALFKQTNRQSILYQVMDKFVDTIESREFIQYFEKTKHDTPYLHLVFLQALSHVQNKLAKFSKNIVNITLAKTSEDSKSIDLPGVKAEHVKDLVRYVARFVDKQNNHRADLTFDKTTPSFAFTKQMILVEPEFSARESNKSAKKKSEQPPASTNEAKKPRIDRNGSVRPTAGAGKAKESMGIFHFKKIDTATTACFPGDLEVPGLCGRFCVQGRKCKHDDAKACAFRHVARVKQLSSSDMTKLCKAMDSTKLFWFDKDALTQQKFTLPTEYAHLMGDASGPTRA